MAPIPGIQSKEEIDEIIELYEHPAALTEADLADIEQIRSDLGTKFCHRCEYCMPCEQGVIISTVLGFKSTSRRLMPAAAINMVAHAMESAENCEDCGECLERCPYELSIPDLLKENLSLYKEFVKQHE